MEHQKETLSRRSFLKGTAALGASLALPVIIPASARGADGHVAPSNRLVMGCIGVGRQGTADMKGFLNYQDLRIVAVCDVDSGHAADAKKIVDKAYGNSDCRTYGDFRELVARPDIDVVTVVTPDHWHTLAALAAIRAGKDAYVEKPLTLTIQEGKVLRDAVRKHGAILQTGSQQRSDNNFRFACELARNGRIGKIEKIVAVIPANNVFAPTWQPEPIPAELNYDFWLGQAPWEPYTTLRCHYSFRFVRDYSGGQVTNFGAHHIDISQWALGMDDSGPVEVTGHGEYPPEGLFNTASKVFFECTYANGVKLICQTSGSGAPPANVNIFGSEGTVYVSRGKIWTDPEPLVRTKIGPDEINLTRSRDHYRNFLDCVKTRTEPIAGVEIGHRSATVCHLGNIAMLLGRKLKWDPQAEQIVGDETANAMCARAMRAPWNLGV